jgi:hypothetical protein
MGKGSLAPNAGTYAANQSQTECCAAAYRWRLSLMQQWWQGKVHHAETLGRLPGAPPCPSCSSATSSGDVELPKAAACFFTENVSVSGPP